MLQMPGEVPGCQRGMSAKRGAATLNLIPAATLPHATAGREVAKALIETGVPSALVRVAGLPADAEPADAVRGQVWALIADIAAQAECE